MHNVINNNATLTNIRHSYFLNMLISYKVQVAGSRLQAADLRPETGNLKPFSNIILAQPPVQGGSG